MSNTSDDKMQLLSQCISSEDGLPVASSRRDSLEELELVQDAPNVNQQVLAPSSVDKQVGIADAQSHAQSLLLAGRSSPTDPALRAEPAHEVASLRDMNPFAPKTTSLYLAMENQALSVTDASHPVPPRALLLAPVRAPAALQALPEEEAQALPVIHRPVHVHGDNDESVVTDDGLDVAGEAAALIQQDAETADASDAAAWQAYEAANAWAAAENDDNAYVAMTDDEYNAVVGFPEQYDGQQYDADPAYYAYTGYTTADGVYTQHEPYVDDAPMGGAGGPAPDEDADVPVADGGSAKPSSWYQVKDGFKSFYNADASGGDVDVEADALIESDDDLKPAKHKKKHKERAKATAGALPKAKSFVNKSFRVDHATSVLSSNARADGSQPLNKCSVCLRRDVEGSSMPCRCDLVCVKCFNAEQVGDEVFCPRCMQLVTEYVPYTDPARLQQWTDHAAMENWQAQLDGSTHLREVEGWDEFEDNASGLKFYWQKERNEVVWDKPAEVLEFDARDEAAARFDPFAAEGLGVDFESTAWKPPMVEKALEERKVQLFGGGESSLWSTSSNDLIHLGVGITLYFKILKSLVFTMLLGCLFFVPLLILYSSGRRVPSSTPDPLRFSKISLGNIGYSEDDSTASAASFATFFGAPLSGAGATALITAMDFAFSLLFLIAVVLLTRHVSSVIDIAQRKLVSAADYTVFVRNLPRNADEAEVRKFFEKLFRLDANFDDDEDELSKWAIIARCLRGMRKQTRKLTARASAFAMAKKRSSLSLGKRYSLTSNKVHVQDNEIGVAEAEVLADPVLPTATGIAHSASKGVQNVLILPTSEALQSAPVLDVLDASMVDSEASPALPAVDTIATIDTAPAATDAPVVPLLSSISQASTIYPHSDSLSHIETLLQQAPDSIDVTAPLSLSRAELLLSHESPLSPSSRPSTSPEQIRKFGRSVDALLGPSVLRSQRNVSGSSSPSPSSSPNVRKGSQTRRNVFFATVDEHEPSGVSEPPEAPGHITINDTHVPHKADETHLSEVEIEYFTVHDTSHNHKKDYMGSWIADVVLTHPIGDTVRKYLQFKDFAAKLRNARAKVKMYSENTTLPSGPDHDKRAKALRAVNDLEFKLLEAKKRFTDKDKDEMSDVDGAFITFNNEESYLRCLSTFKRHDGWFGKVFNPVPTRLMFRKRKVLKVVAAPDPSELNWENLDSSRLLVSLRRFSTFCATLFVVLASFLIILVAQNARARFQALVPDFSMCNSDIPALIMRSYDGIAVGYKDIIRNPVPGSSEFQRAFVLQRLPPAQRADEDVQCQAMSAYYIAFRGLNTTTLSYLSASCQSGYLNSNAALSELYNLTLSSTKFNPSCPDPVRAPNQCPCLNPTGDGNCQTLSCFNNYKQFQSPPYNKKCKQFPVTTLTGCYCVSRLDQLVKLQGIFSGLKTFLTVDKDVCNSFAGGYILAQALVSLAAVVGSIANKSADMLIKIFVKFERHRSISNESWAYASKSLVAKFINTGVVALVVYGTLPSNVAAPVQKIGLLNGKFDDFTTGWYASAGVYISTFMLINTIVPFLAPIGDWVLTLIRRWRAVRGKQTSSPLVTQEEMNRLFIGPVFELETRYTEVLVALLTTLMYGLGLPILFLYAFAGFTIRYWLDKLLLLRYSKKPPRYGPQLASMALAILPWALLLHLGLSVWMVSSPGLLPSGVLPSSQNSTQFFDSWNGASRGDPLSIWPRIMRQNAFPLFLLFVLLGSLLIALAVGGRTVIKLGQKLFRRCGGLRLKHKSTRKWTSPFTADFGRIVNVESFIQSTESQDGVHVLRNAINAPKPEAVTTAQGDDDVVVITDASPPHALLPVPVAVQHRFENQLLSKVELQQGWRLEMSNAVDVLRKVFTNSIQNVLYPHLSHDFGDFKRTWQVIEDAGLFNYEIRSNHIYRDAILAMKEGEAAAEIDEGSSDEDK